MPVGVSRLFIGILKGESMKSTFFDYARRIASNLLSLSLLVSSAVPPAIAQTHNKEPIRIGFIASLSGPATPSSKAMVNGIKLYLDQIHNEINGRPVVLKVENDEGNPTVGK